MRQQLLSRTTGARDEHGRLALSNFSDSVENLLDCRAASLDLPPFKLRLRTDVRSVCSGLIHPNLFLEHGDHAPLLVNSFHLQLQFLVQSHDVLLNFDAVHGDVGDLCQGIQERQILRRVGSSVLLGPQRDRSRDFSLAIKGIQNFGTQGT